MDAPRLFVGVDVASETLAVAVTPGPGRPNAAAFSVPNDPDGFAAEPLTSSQRSACERGLAVPLLVSTEQRDHGR
jgi:hypothetical protein